MHVQGARAATVIDRDDESERIGHAFFQRQGVGILRWAAQRLLAFSGHKGLLGPQGTGGLYVRDERALEPLLRGGTGSRSDQEEQPEFLPDRYESGTLNTPGIAGLGAGVEYLLRRGVQSVQAHERRLLEQFLDGVGVESRITTYGPPGSAARTGVLSLNVAGLSCAETGSALEDRFGLLTRVGLHCAPLAHRSLGTFPHGTVRFSWGVFTRAGEVHAAVRALRRLAQEEPSGAGQTGAPARAGRRGKFFGSYHAMRAESLLRKSGRPAVLIPGPREISPNCGVALRFDHHQKEEVQELFDRGFVQYESFHYYPHRRVPPRTLSSPGCSE